VTDGENLADEKKVGLELLLRVKRSGRSFYLKIPQDIAGIYLLKPKDTLRVELKTLIRAETEAGD
jgi:hypothetical protein